MTTCKKADGKENIEQKECEDFETEKQDVLHEVFDKIDYITAEIHKQLSVMSDKILIAKNSNENLSVNKEITKKACSSNKEHNLLKESHDSLHESPKKLENYGNMQRTEDGKENVEQKEYEDFETEKTICVKNIFEETMLSSDAEKALTEFFFNHFPGTKIMNLRPKSNFSLLLDLSLQQDVLHEVFDKIDYITAEIHSLHCRTLQQ
ncbi:17409_t:CDS:2 [Entrophospora sp. SA101]|nr:17409_t:CDS:2 [Entrophospora sp. SA101]